MKFKTLEHIHSLLVFDAASKNTTYQCAESVYKEAYRDPNADEDDPAWIERVRFLSAEKKTAWRASVVSQEALEDFESHDFQ